MKYTIIGAGIGGLTTALAFEQKGIDYQLYEKATELNTVGAGIWLAPNALQVLESLGLLAEIKANGNSIDRITLAKANSVPLTDTKQGFVKELFGYSTIAIHRAKLQKILLEKIPAEKIFLGKEFKSFSKLDSEKIKVSFEDNSEIETDFLIGADGINSKVRKQLFPSSKIRYSGQTCWRGIANFSLEEDLAHRGVEFWGKHIRFGFSKIVDDKVYWFAVALAKPNQKDKENSIKAELIEKLSDFYSVVGELLQATEESKIMRNDINDLKPMQNWHKDGICLIGDAGHATTPNIGQGGAQAIEDAHYLSDLIENSPEENVFDQFQNKRKMRVDMIVRRSKTVGKMAHWKFGTRFRNSFLANIPDETTEKQMIDLYQLED